MNAMLKSILTNPFVIGGTAVGAGITAGAIIYAKNRPKTDAEIELEKQKEANAEAERQRQHERDMEKIKAKQAADEVESQEQTKRDAKKQEERTKQLELEIQKLKDQREWEKVAPEGYWQLKIAEANASGIKATAEKEASLQRDIAKMQADSAKYAADRNAQAIKDREHYSYLRQESNNQAASQNMQTMFGSLASMVTGKVD